VSQGRVDAERLAALARGELDAVAEALDCVEDTRAWRVHDQVALLEALEAGASRVRDAEPTAGAVIGLTGPPGAGKSTLAGVLIERWLERGLRVGMLLIDPSSRRSGGALLGDRLRLPRSLVAKYGERIFVRSMAARLQLGGLAPATRAAACVLHACFDRTLIETVGVGQSEIDIATVADLSVLVLPPEAGDAIQLMKAGIVETPDIALVHKCDVGRAARRTHADLLAAVSRGSPAGPPPAVVSASSSTGRGIDELLAAIDARLAALYETGALARRRAESQVEWALARFAERYGTYGIDRLGGPAAARTLAATLAGSGLARALELARRAKLE
jgi:LAO/AO transport system kinase